MAHRGLTRRDLLARAAALGVGLVAWRSSPGPTASASQPPAALGPGELRTYAALVVAVCQARGLPRTRRVVRERVGHLRQAYAEAPDARQVRAVLGGLDAASAPRRFASLSVPQRIGLLRTLQETPVRTGGDGPDLANLARRQLAAEAQALVLSPAGTGDYPTAGPTPL